MATFQVSFKGREGNTFKMAVHDCGPNSFNISTVRLSDDNRELDAHRELYYGDTQDQYGFKGEPGIDMLIKCVRYHLEYTRYEFNEFSRADQETLWRLFVNNMLPDYVASFAQRVSRYAYYGLNTVVSKELEGDLLHEFDASYNKLVKEKESTVEMLKKAIDTLDSVKKDQEQKDEALASAFDEINKILATVTHKVYGGDNVKASIAMADAEFEKLEADRKLGTPEDYEQLDAMRSFVQELLRIVREIRDAQNSDEAEQAESDADVVKAGTAETTEAVAEPAADNA